MKKPLTVCCNGDGRPVHPPSWVLCRECLAVLDAKVHALKAPREGEHIEGGGYAK